MKPLDLSCAKVPNTYMYVYMCVCYLEFLNRDINSLYSLWLSSSLILLLGSFLAPVFGWTGPTGRIRLVRRMTTLTRPFSGGERAYYDIGHCSWMTFEFHQWEVSLVVKQVWSIDTNTTCSIYILRFSAEHTISCFLTKLFGDSDHVL